MDDENAGCSNCGEGLGEDESQNPYFDDCGEILCDRCYEEMHLDYCPICEDMYPKPSKAEETFFVLSKGAANKMDLVGGVYRVKRYPYFRACVVFGVDGGPTHKRVRLRKGHVIPPLETLRPLRSHRVRTGDRQNETSNQHPMIVSTSKELCAVEIPHHDGEIKMLPFDLADLASVPEKFQAAVKQMIDFLPAKAGEAYLTVDGRVVEKGRTHRRGAPHIDGNYLYAGSWDRGGGNGWKVGEGGREITSEEHRLSYCSATGGMIIASNYPACKGWNGTFSADAKEGGDCSHINLGDGFLLKPNVAYYGNSQWIHESLPIDKTAHRTIIRITLPTAYPNIA